MCQGITEFCAISIHAPHARSDCCHHVNRDKDVISIHAPHARSDTKNIYGVAKAADFNPRSSCEERRTIHFCGRPSRCDFNPRSSCEERRLLPLATDCDCDFNPRSSCEERLTMPPAANFGTLFQSTLLMRGATIFGAVSSIAVCIFQSTLLMRGATRDEYEKAVNDKISIHAPHARSDNTKSYLS